MHTEFALDAPLRAVGALLADRGQSAAVVIVGGAALNLLGVVRRATRDVDVIAIGRTSRAGPPVSISAPTPFPAHLQDAVERVARDFGLPDDWLNATVGGQWETGLPPGLERRIQWTTFGALWVGLPGRIDLIFLKLYAAADDVGPSSRHFTDLLELRPTREELAEAREWITNTQDASPAMRDQVAHVIRNVTKRTR